jgi:hypothetical protein
MFLIILRIVVIYCHSCDIETPSDSLRALAVGCPELRKLFLTALRGVSERELLLLAERCHHLEQLDLLGARAVTPDICLRSVQVIIC